MMKRRAGRKANGWIALMGIVAMMGGWAEAADPISGINGIKAVARKFGPESVAAIVELRGQKGQDQPVEWELISWDENALMNLHKYWIGEGTATDEDNAGDVLYPNNPPNGFVTMDRVRIDSTDAFAIAESQARTAKMGFNSLNYVLAAMEYATEPVWTLDLIDASDRLVGKVFLSAETGEVLRTLWIYRDSAKIRVVDSAAPRKEELTPEPEVTDERAIITPSADGTPTLAPMPELIPTPPSEPEPPVTEDEGVTPPPTMPTTVPSPPSLEDDLIPPPPIPGQP